MAAERAKVAKGRQGASIGNLATLQREEPGTRAVGPNSKIAKVAKVAKVARLPTAPTRPPRKPKTRPVGSPGKDDRLRYATRNGAKDGKCHWLVSRSRTLCGQPRRPPLSDADMHMAPPCPNGNDPCAECVRAASEWGQE